jgi:hypothetical protein
MTSEKYIHQVSKTHVQFAFFIDNVIAVQLMLAVKNTSNQALYVSELGTSRA